MTIPAQTEMLQTIREVEATLLLLESKGMVCRTGDFHAGRPVWRALVTDGEMRERQLLLAPTLAAARPGRRAMVGAVAKTIVDGAALESVSIPITCPECGALELMEYPAIVVAVATIRWNNMRLTSPCHDVGWDASPMEMRTIRGFLARTLVNGELCRSEWDTLATGTP